MASLRIHPPGHDKTVDVALAFGALIMLAVSWLCDSHSKERNGGGRESSSTSSGPPQVFSGPFCERSWQLLQLVAAHLS